MKKQATESTRKTNGDRLIHMRTHQGTRCSGERLLKSVSVCSNRWL